MFSVNNKDNGTNSNKVSNKDTKTMSMLSLMLTSNIFYFFSIDSGVDF